MEILSSFIIYHTDHMQLINCRKESTQYCFDDLVVIPCKKNKVHGVCIGYYPGGKLAFKISYKKNLAHGEHKGWFGNGSVSYTEQYVHGKLHGSSIKYDRRGRVVQFIYYKRDVAHLHTRDYESNYKNWSYPTFEEMKSDNILRDLIRLSADESDKSKLESLCKF